MFGCEQMCQVKQEYRSWYRHTNHLSEKQTSDIPRNDTYWTENAQDHHNHRYQTQKQAMEHICDPRYAIRTRLWERDWNNQTAENTVDEMGK